MKIAVIPARGGSQRIPRKNIRTFCGKPMIAWSIEAARSSGLFEQIIISTDNVEVAEVAKLCGASVPFMRPKELADDHTGTTAVIAHATQWALKQGFKIDAVCCIYATAAFMQEDDLKLGWEALQKGDWDYSFAVTEYAAPIFRSFKETAEGGLEMFFPENFSIRSQDLPVALHDAAQFYWGRPQAWLEARSIFGSRSKPIVIPRWRVQDIDNWHDWKRAELVFNQLQSEEP